MGLESRVVYTSMDVIEGTCDLEKALVKDRRAETLRLLAASQKNNKNDIQPVQMKKVCLELKEAYDYVLIDSPAGIEQGFQNAAVGASEALIVTTPEVAAVRDADRIIGLLQSMDISKIHLIINRLVPEMVQSGDMMNQNDVIDILSIKLIGVIPEDREVVVSTNRGLPLTTHDRRTNAGEAYKRIAQRIEGDEIPIPTFKPESWFTGLVDKLFNWG
jgi:septum site-determining protein MinD